MTKRMILGAAGLVLSTVPALAEWRFSGGPTPNAFVQVNDMTLELQCDRIRFAPAGFADSEDIAAKQSLSIRFMSDSTTEVGAFQVGASNATIGIVDNFPIEIVFSSPDDVAFVFDQIAANAFVDLSMIDQDISYGTFDLTGSSAAIRSLTSACAGTSAASTTPEAPEGRVYCSGDRQLEYVIFDRADGEWDAQFTLNGDTTRAMTAYSFFGNATPPAGFVVALLGEDNAEVLVFSDGGQDWIELGDSRYTACN